MLRLPPFRYLRPRSLADAAAALAGEGAGDGLPVRLVAGGTDLWPNLKRRHQKASTVVSLMGIPGLEEISANGEVAIGATALLADVANHSEIAGRYPALARAVDSISSPPLRHMGTIGGNLCVDTRCTYYNQTEEWRRSIGYCLKEEGTVCWVAPGSRTCLAHAASDSAPMLAALGARVRLASPGGERAIAVEDLYRDDGIAYLGKRPEEILTGILLPAQSDARSCRSAFWKLRRRGSIDFAVLSVAAAAWIDAAGTVTRARIFLGAVASAPVAATAAAAALVGKPLDPESIARAARLCREVATPMDNTDFQAQWRNLMVERYAEAALREIAGLPASTIAPKHPL
ncbi:MAG TPA: FAD binding domain-containing protein [Thermoanaerobaculia bacterium]|jgi:4-hydroxybenzoyl-CoA reductase subunit beta